MHEQTIRFFFHLNYFLTLFFCRCHCSLIFSRGQRTVTTPFSIAGKLGGSGAFYFNWEFWELEKIGHASRGKNRVVHYVF